MNRKVLMVDDEPEILDVLKSRFSSKGFEVVCAANGSSAIEWASKLIPDIILLDVTIPEPNGYKVCRQLKDDDILSRIPIVLLTARDSESDRFWGEEAGADAYITKPYKLEELMETAEKLMTEARQEF